MRSGDVSRKRRLKGDLRAFFYADYRTARMASATFDVERDTVVANAVDQFRRRSTERKALIDARKRQMQISMARQELVSRVWNQFNDSLSLFGTDQVLLMGDGSIFQSRGMAATGKHSFKRLKSSRPWHFEGLVQSNIRIGGSRSRSGVFVSKDVAFKLRSIGDFVLGANNDRH